MNHIDILVGRRIAEARSRQGLAREALARELNIAPWLIGEIEDGRRRASARQLFAIGDLLGVAVTRFFMGTKGGQVQSLCPATLFRPGRCNL
ncbi:helix-turn-helix domain-containing protein [Salipiger mucosus]|uniref:helix-turn-helix domain-containing protein n=1 Tax=Salipiger mucosus TaxID=263378 RepID=UPI00056736BD|nr:helix-turn-helix transcriptional regulator [Salipiger mucosus]